MEQIGAGLSGQQLPCVRTGVALETQLRKIVSDTDILAIETGVLRGLLCAAMSHTQARGLVKLEVTQKG
ncbi:unnamed protein product [Closterium sp. NIES-64]|nr:unnamed protein product [Closterium sp. NIES-64]